MNETDWKHADFLISTDPGRLDCDLIHRYLSEESYWAKGRPRAVVEKAIRHSLCFGLYHGVEQIGFTRIVSDFATFAWLADVFVLPDYRGRGLSKWMMRVVSSHPDLQGLRRWILATKDAHGLYARYGFTPLDDPDRFMVKFADPPDYSAVRL